MATAQLQGVTSYPAKTAAQSVNLGGQHVLVNIGRVAFIYLSAMNRAADAEFRSLRCKNQCINGRSVQGARELFPTRQTTKIIYTIYTLLIGLCGLSYVLCTGVCTGVFAGITRIVEFYVADSSARTYMMTQKGVPYIKILVFFLNVQ